MAEIMRRKSWGGVLPLGRHASIRGSSFIQCASVSIALSSVQGGQTARLHKQFKLEQALVAIQPGHTLVTSGVYGVIRHPSYLGLLVNALGWALAFHSGVGGAADSAPGAAAPRADPRGGEAAAGSV